MTFFDIVMATFSLLVTCGFALYSIHWFIESFFGIHLGQYFLGLFNEIDREIFLLKKKEHDLKNKILPIFRDTGLSYSHPAKEEYNKEMKKIEKRLEELNVQKKVSRSHDYMKSYYPKIHDKLNEEDINNV